MTHTHDVPWGYIKERNKSRNLEEENSMLRTVIKKLRSNQKLEEFEEHFLREKGL